METIDVAADSDTEKLDEFKLDDFAGDKDIGEGSLTDRARKPADSFFTKPAENSHTMKTYEALNNMNRFIQSDDSVDYDRALYGDKESGEAVEE